MGYQKFKSFGKFVDRNPLVFEHIANRVNMRPHLDVVTGIDPNVTRAFLLSQPKVLNALVWYQRGRLHAEVAVADEQTSAGDLQRQCERALGLLQAPKEITLIAMRPRAA